MDHKPPSKHFPCDYCTTVQAICSTHYAEGKKLEPFIDILDKDYKSHQFSDILNKGVERENLELRQKLEGLQEIVDRHMLDSESKDIIIENLRAQIEQMNTLNCTRERAYNEACASLDQERNTNQRLKDMINDRSDKGTTMDFVVEPGQAGVGMRKPGSGWPSLTDSAQSDTEMGKMRTFSHIQSEKHHESSGIHP